MDDIFAAMELLVIGLPDQRPGGLVLTLLLFLLAGAFAIVLGLFYAVVTTVLPAIGMPLQAASALLRGVPPLLLVFMLAHLVPASTMLAGLLALTLYSFSHTGEILRSFLGAYPASLSEQAKIMGLGILGEWLRLRLPWTLWRGLPALLTHWASLLKDTGALLVIGIGELTTVAKLLSESSAAWDRWVTIISLAGGLYLLATVSMLRLMPVIVRATLRLPPEQV